MLRRFCERSLPVAFFAVGLAILASVAGMNRTTQAGLLKCTPDTSWGCSTCDSTGQVFQCKPKPLDPGLVYGSCIRAPGACAGPFVVLDCGDKDFDCQRPPQEIVGPGSCITNTPQVCVKN
jgi:hypothetical protein